LATHFSGGKLKEIYLVENPAKLMDWAFTLMDLARGSAMDITLIKSLHLTS